MRKLNRKDIDLSNCLSDSHDLHHHHQDAYRAAAVVFFTRHDDGSVAKVLVALEAKRSQHTVAINLKQLWGVFLDRNQQNCLGDVQKGLEMP